MVGKDWIIALSVNIFTETDVFKLIECLIYPPLQNKLSIKAMNSIYFTLYKAMSV